MSARKERREKKRGLRRPGRGDGRRQGGPQKKEKERKKERKRRAARPWGRKRGNPAEKGGPTSPPGRRHQTRQAKSPTNKMRLPDWRTAEKAGPSISSSPSETEAVSRPRRMTVTTRIALGRCMATEANQGQERPQSVAGKGAGAKRRRTGTSGRKSEKQKGRNKPRPGSKESRAEAQQGGG